MEQGRHFNFFVELDNGTEPVRSKQHRQNIQRKIRFYERLQDGALAAWKRGRRDKPPPRYRVLFFLRSRERIEHVLAAARDAARNPDRHLCLGVPLGAYLSDPNPLHAPLALDHHGCWQSTVDQYPSVALPPRSTFAHPRRRLPVLRNSGRCATLGSPVARPVPAGRVPRRSPLARRARAATARTPRRHGNPLCTRKRTPDRAGFVTGLRRVPTEINPLLSQ